MADGIYYNQEVTADMINEIAIDLGHTSFNGFGTDKFGAAELNNITKELVTSGILLSDSKCRPVYSEGYINIQPGTIVFADGAKKKITAVVSFESQGAGVIYALNDTVAGNASLVYKETYPESGDYVKICTVTDSGVVDAREYAKPKVELASGKRYNIIEATSVTIPSGSDVAVMSFSEADLEGFDYIVIIQKFPFFTHDICMKVSDFIASSENDYEEIFEHTTNSGNKRRLSRKVHTILDEENGKNYELRYLYYYTNGSNGSGSVGCILI